MTVSAININNNPRRKFTEFKTSPHIPPVFKRETGTPEKKCSTAGVFLTTLMGVGTALAMISKKQGFSLNPQKILNTKVKDWALVRIFNKNHPEAKVLEFEEPEILTMAAGSVAGGLVGGAIFDDKKYFKAKAREAVNQMLGNVIIPVAFVGGTSRIYDKYKTKILSFVPQINYSKNNALLKKLSNILTPNSLDKTDKALAATVKYTNKFLKVIPPSALTIVALGVGIFTGNKVSNFINEKVFHKKVERKIHGTDFAPHVDDLSMAISLMADKSAVSSVISRTIPAFLCVPGMETGTHR